jgi:hypothetical protein
VVKTKWAVFSREADREVNKIVTSICRDIKNDKYDSFRDAELDAMDELDDLMIDFPGDGVGDSAVREGVYSALGDCWDDFEDRDRGTRRSRHGRRHEYRREERRGGRHEVGRHERQIEDAENKLEDLLVDMTDKNEIDGFEMEESKGQLMLEIEGTDGGRYTFTWDSKGRPVVSRSRGRGKYEWAYDGLPFLALGKDLDDLYRNEDRGHHARHHRLHR